MRAVVGGDAEVGGRVIEVARPERDDKPGEPEAADTLRERLQRAMTLGAGVLRSHESLERTTAAVDSIRRSAAVGPDDASTWEVRNLVTVANAVIAAATERRRAGGLTPVRTSLTPIPTSASGWCSDERRGGARPHRFRDRHRCPVGQAGRRARRAGRAGGGRRLLAGGRPDRPCGRAGAVAALLVCLIPAAAFTVLWWLARTVAELAGHLPADLGVAARRLQDTPGQLVGAARRVTDAKGLVKRSREIRSVIGDVKALNPEEEASHDRLEKLYASFGTITPVALSRSRRSPSPSSRSPCSW